MEVTENRRKQCVVWNKRDLVKVRQQQRSYEQLRLQERGRKTAKFSFFSSKYSKQTNHHEHPFASYIRLKTPEEIWPLASFLFLSQDCLCTWPLALFFHFLTINKYSNKQNILLFLSQKTKKGPHLLTGTPNSVA